MGWFSLCEGDPLLSLLRDVFGAQPVQVPEERFQPLVAIAVAGRKAYFRGELRELLTGRPDLRSKLRVEEGRMADVTGKKSRDVSIDLGLKVLDGFLRVFNIPSGGINTAFNGAQTVAFSFSNVARHYIDPPSLGQELKRRKLDRSNPVNRRFLTGEHHLHVIESIIVSNEFSLHVETVRDAAFEINIPIIRNLIEQAEANVSLRSASSTAISFSGSRPLTFAFTCSRFYLGEEGAIWSVDPSKEEIILGAESAARRAGARLMPSPTRVLLREQPGLFSFDEDDE